MSLGGYTVNESKLKNEPKSLYEKMIDQNKKEMREALFVGNVAAAPSHHTNRIVPGHLMAVRDNDEGAQKMSYLENQDILHREFGEKQKDITSNTIGKVSGWTTRTVDWYNSERRIIFATKSEQDRENWIKYFKTYAIAKIQRQNDFRFTNPNFDF